MAYGLFKQFQNRSGEPALVGAAEFFEYAVYCSGEFFERFNEVGELFYFFLRIVSECLLSKLFYMLQFLIKRTNAIIYYN